MKKNKITKNTVPEGFSLGLALMDLVPVVLFGLSAIRIGQLLRSGLFLAGAAICLISGVLKVLWKLIAAVSRKNIWILFLQMRFLMPAGFAFLLAALVRDWASLNRAAILAKLLSFPACLFFAAGLAGMVLMTFLAFRLDSGDPRANWAEQTVNSLAQLCFFLGLLLLP